MRRAVGNRSLENFGISVVDQCVVPICRKLSQLTRRASADRGVASAIAAAGGRGHPPQRRPSPSCPVGNDTRELFEDRLRVANVEAVARGSGGSAAAVSACSV